MTWLLFMLPALLLSIWAQFRVKSTFHRFARVGSRNGMSGAEVARMLLRAAGVHEVKVERVHGFLSDHYDPTSRTLRLSEATHDSTSVAAIGVAAHEAGHALQHADGYAALRFRSAMVPMLGLGSKLLPFLMIVAIFSGAFQTGGPLAWAVVVVLALIAAFALITLPVEFDASRRAMAVLGSTGILAADELPGAGKVLNAAAFTYVAAAAAAVMELAFWLLQLLGNRSEE